MAAQRVRAGTKLGDILLVQKQDPLKAGMKQESEGFKCWGTAAQCIVVIDCRTVDRKKKQYGKTGNIDCTKFLGKFTLKTHNTWIYAYYSDIITFTCCIVGVWKSFLSNGVT